MTAQTTDDEWKDKLTPEQYHILREKGTGDFVCAACGAVVFKSDTKFDSGSGWPSFYDPANTEAVRLVEDASHGIHRVEVTCANCGGHLGHVFNDAPEQPTGMRFCINSAALDFKAKK